jgi:hypothetical protein
MVVVCFGTARVYGTLGRGRNLLSCLTFRASEFYFAAAAEDLESR